MHEQYVQFYRAIAEPFTAVERVMRAGELPAIDGSRRVKTLGVAGSDSARDVGAAGVRVLREVCMRVDEYESLPGALPLGRIRLAWEPLEDQDVQPTIRADLEIEPIDDRRTMVALLASYEPPLGRLGAIVDRVAMHRVAETALRRFFDGLISELAASLDVRGA